MWNSEKVAAIATQVLIEHLGVSAQFVVEDAIAMGLQAGQIGADSEKLQLSSFLINLASLLPAGVPVDQVRQTILKRYQGI